MACDCEVIGGVVCLSGHHFAILFFSDLQLQLHLRKYSGSSVSAEMPLAEETPVDSVRQEVETAEVAEETSAIDEAEAADSDE